MTMVHSIGKYSMIPLYVLCIAVCYPVSGKTEHRIRNVTADGIFGKEAVIKCIFTPHNLTAKWLFQGADVEFGDRVTQNKTVITSKEKDDDGTAIPNLEMTLKIVNASYADVGNYTCVVDGQSQSAFLNLSYPGKLVEITKGPLRFNITDGAKHVLNLTCIFEVYNQTKVEWILKDKQLEATSTRDTNNPKLLKSYYTTPIVLSNFDDQDGTYICQAWDPVRLQYITGKTEVRIYAAPVLDIIHAVAISSSQIYFNWTVKTYNSPIKRYYLYILRTPEKEHRLATEYAIHVNSTSYVIDKLKKNTTYHIKLNVITEFGASKEQLFPTPDHVVRTLLKDPVFVPNISINGFSSKSMTIGLSVPPPDVADYVHYYVLERWKKGHNEPPKAADHYRDDRNLPYMFNDLDPHSTYVFRARACSDYTKQCGEWSEEMEAVTLDGTPDKPTDVHIDCPKQDGRNYMNLTWGPPAKPNAEIKGYMMEVTGNMTYINRFGIETTDTWGPLSKFMTNNSRTVRVDDLKPNTMYTVRLSAMTRTRRRGLENITHCTTKFAPPDNPPRPKFIKHGKKVDDTIEYSLRVVVPRSSERNGPICCYRVYVVRLPPGSGWSKLPPPAGLRTLTFDEAHAPNAPTGAYITDVFNNEKFPKEELTLGDGVTETLPPPEYNTSCARCFVRRRDPEPPRPTTPTPAPAPEEDTTADDLPTEGEREERSVEDERYADNEILKTKKSVDRDEPINPVDGKLDPRANYTVFVELIPGTDDEPLFSGYTVALNTAIPQNALDTNTMELALKIACGVAAFLLLITLVFCVVHTRRARKLPPAHAHVELNPIQAALRYVVGHMGGRQQLVPAMPPDMPPIAIENLAAAYIARQADSDYEFQKEFELLQMLPECYPDRTCHASEARENQPKNRYPDIKAYDQTRVKLSQIDGITGSDYINANFVMGYKERKKFICAQGPTETTVNDFWRMIWEHGLELIVMLTNLEEYSKVKCSKYWPDELRGARAFGSITVHHVAEKRYSDYIVRELKITKQPTNSEGQPIVETNGVAKRNGDCKDAESASAPTSPRENKDGNSRIVRQYHFLMWKDFAAPEHPQSILRFIKRVNEAWSGLLGRPCVVHCSAGVGRTGTLVALDCLLEQLRGERRAAVFATVAELRRQRNFLVQSLKQYVFVYRALLEYAHYGDTEIPASRLKASIDRLRNTPEGADKCLMEHEFEKILNPPVPEPVKSCAAGAVEEARARNRSQDCLPYDRNRVILTPAPPTNYCTYINASFIEAYDNSEGYIITQDPLPNTIMDFWRMVSEHNVSTIVMLSELGEGKCPRYWDDGTAQYEHISVQYEESESCPYYTRRQFRVTNNKSGDVTSVRQLQYHGWPTAPGHVPEVTRGLAELADAARQAVAPQPASAMALHCQYGTERSALFATLCVLIAQLRTERRVDVCAAARKVRSQRAHTIDTSLQYEFLHRAILNYAELHNLLEDS